MHLYLNMIACILVFSSATTASAENMRFTHVNVVDVKNGRVLRDRTVVIEGNRIASVRSTGNVAAQADARTIDATGKYLIPGLWDMHTHNVEFTSGLSPSTWHFPSYIANGVTGVRDLWVKPQDMPLIRKWRDGLAKGTFVGPRFVAVGTIVDGPWDAQPGHYPGPNVDVAATPQQGRDMVDKLQAAGIDFFKPYNALSRDVYLAVADEAKRRHFPIAGHTPFAVGARVASDSGQASIEHLTGVLQACSSEEATLFAQANAAHRKDQAYYQLEVSSYDDARCTALARRFVRNRTAITPTLVIARIYMTIEPPSFFADDPRLLAVPKDVRSGWQKTIEQMRGIPAQVKTIGRRRWAELLRITKLMQDQGVLVLAGTDDGNPLVYPGSSLLEELSLLHEAGLTPLQALRAATLNPARFLHLEDRFGTVEAGKMADLVLLDANPLADIANTRRIDAVMLNGRLFDRTALDAMSAVRFAAVGPHDR